MLNDTSLQNLIAYIKRHRARLVLLFGVAILFFIVSKVSIIEIETEGGSGDYQYQVVDQSSGKAKSHKSTKASKTVFISRGSYEITVRSGDGNYFATATAKGFFRKTKLAGKLETEKSRKFIGENPAPCVAYLSNILYSNECSGAFFSTYEHVPATKDMPQYKRLISPGTTEAVEYGGHYDSPKTIVSIFTTKEGTMAIVKPYIANDSATGLTLYRLGTGMKVVEETSLGALNPNETYQASAYREGFLISSKGSSDAFYYASSKSQPEKISFDAPEKKEVSRLTVHSDKENILAVRETADELNGHEDEENKHPSYTELQLINGDFSRKYNFNTTYKAVKLCPHTTICILDNDKLVIYDATGKKLKLQTTISGVSDIETLNDSSVLVIRKSEIIAFDPQKNLGTIDLSLGEQSFNRLSILSDQSYMLHVLDTGAKQNALLIDRAQVSDGIDQKIIQLRKSTYLKSASIYGKFVWVVPNIGEPEYNPKTGLYEDSPERTATANAEILKAATTAGINTSEYHIISTN